jgi:hypothetical protein
MSSSHSDEDEYLDSKEDINHHSKKNGLQKAKTIARRATIFAGNFNVESGEEIKTYSKSVVDLKRSQQLSIMEFKTIGKQRQFEIASETSENMLIRFILHFMFVEHDHRMIDLFDPQDSIFKSQNKTQSISEVMQELRNSPVKKFSLSPTKKRR